jgi:hypothetical protein
LTRSGSGTYAALRQGASAVAYQQCNKSVTTVY